MIPLLLDLSTVNSFWLGDLKSLGAEYEVIDLKYIREPNHRGL